MRKLYGRGFKILLDMIAAAHGQVIVADSVPDAQPRAWRKQLGVRVIAEFFMLILYHLTGRMLPARFFLFGWSASPASWCTSGCYLWFSALRRTSCTVRSWRPARQ